MGLLDGIFGGNRDGKSGGGISPITLGLLALLAYRTYQGKGRLADMLGRGENDPKPAGQRPMSGQTPDGSIFGGNAGGVPGAGGGLPGGLDGLLRGGLGGLLGGAAAGGLLSGGLGDLLKRFQDNGQGEKADSWVSRGPNQRIAPEEVEHAVGRETLQELSDQTGRPYDQVLSDLSESLPDAVDRLTPEGRMPTEQEAARWL